MLSHQSPYYFYPHMWYHSWPNSLQYSAYLFDMGHPCYMAWSINSCQIEISAEQFCITWPYQGSVSAHWLRSCVFGKLAKLWFSHWIAGWSPILNFILIINRTLHAHLGIRILSSLADCSCILHSLASLSHERYYQHSEIKCVATENAHTSPTV